MFFRKMEASEVDIVRKIYNDSFGDAISGDLDYSISNIYVVTLEDVIVGMCMINFIDHVFSGVRVLYLNDVCVDKNFRNRGVASFMLRMVDNFAVSSGVKYIMLTSNKKRCGAIDLYMRNGFSLYDTNVFRKELG